MAAHVHHIVDAAQHPEISLLIAAGRIAGEVCAGNTAPILLLESLGIAQMVRAMLGQGRLIIR